MKNLKTIFALTLALVMVFALCSCDNGGKGDAVTAKGTWYISNLGHRTIEQGDLLTGNFNTISLFSDNTFILTSDYNSYYSSDGGESYNPTFEYCCVVYGKYETVSSNDEIGESTIKIVSVDRIVSGESDTSKDDLSAEDTENYLTKNPAVGTELILSSDCRMSDMVKVGNYGMNYGM